MNSREKGKRGELEFAGFLKERGYEEARRGQQFAGGPESPDVRGVRGIHFEVKRVENLNLEAAMAQSVRDAAPGSIPVVAHRRNRSAWKITLSADAFFDIWQRAERPW